MTSTEIKLHKDIALKDGTTIKKGAIITWIGPSEKFPHTVGIFSHNGIQRKFRYRSVLKVPSMRWSMDGVAEDCIHGERIEPDGVTSDGSPSWLLAVGLI
jgi:hypothetical protein